MQKTPSSEFQCRPSNEDQIPKPNQQEGLGIGWPASETNMEKLKTYFNEVKAKM